MSKTRVQEFLRWLLSASLFLSFAVFTVFTTSPVSAADAPTASWTVDSAYSSSSSSASQVIGSNPVIKFHLTKPNSFDLRLASTGVGAVDSSTPTSESTEDVISISISSSVAGTQTLTATGSDQAGTPLTSTFTITWLTTGIHLTYKKMA